MRATVQRIIQRLLVTMRGMMMRFRRPGTGSRWVFAQQHIDSAVTGVKYMFTVYELAIEEETDNSCDTGDGDHITGTGVDERSGTLR